MGESTYIGLIKYNNIGLEYILGNIDTEILINRKIEALYYFFPLIEKMILEIFKLVPEADVEYISQGIMKTPISLIESNENCYQLPENIVEIIKKYYGEDGVRNKLFHVIDKEINIVVDYKEILYLVSVLLCILRDKTLEYDEKEFINIELI